MKVASTLLLLLTMMGQVQADELEKQWKQASGDDYFRMPKTEELALANQLFKDTLNNRDSRAAWAGLSMESVDDGALLIIRELPTHRQGRGFFAIKKQPGTQNWLLQAPHGDSDLYTGKIAARLFEQGSFKAGQWNTVPRDTAIQDSQDHADMAHLSDSYWQAFTQSFAEQWPSGKIVQIHGFDQSARESKSAANSDMILSAGHSQPPAWLQQTAQCLKNAFPGRVKLYPFDVKDLGGTQNSQNHLLSNMRHQGFLHIELSKPMREQLLEQSDARQRLIDCLLAADSITPK